MPQIKKVHRLSATYKKEMLTEQTLGNFEFLANRRDIRKSRVSSLRLLLQKGKHFDTPLMVNIKDGKMRLLDGNHRIEAITQHLEKFKDHKVEVGIFCYNNLSEQEEKEIYTRWNLGTRQTVNDFVKQYWNDMYIAKKLARDCVYPIGPKHKATVFEFRQLMNSYQNCQNPKYTGSGAYGALNFINWCKSLGDKDFAIINEFLKEYISIFGNPNRKNMYYKQNVLTPIMHIWVNNLQNVTNKQMETALLRLRGHERVVYYAGMGHSREIGVAAHGDFLRVINARRKKALFK